MKKTMMISCSIVFSLFSFLIPPHIFAEVDLLAETAVSIEATTGEILFDKGAHEKRFPASTTKVMTGLLAMENIKEDERIVFSKKALEQDKSNYIIEFKEGESVDRNTALSILMLLSANDMAYAIAEHIAGSEEAFGKMMTERARQLGAVDTNFVTASGLHHPNHVTTAYDLALIAQEASKHDILLKDMGTKNMTVTTSLQTKSIKNRSKVFENPVFLAGKTGFTDPAGNTLVEIDKQDDKEIINVVMKSKNPAYYEDMKKISSFVFPTLQKKQVLDKDTWSSQLSFLDKKVDVKLAKDVAVFQKEEQTLKPSGTPISSVKTDDELYEHGIKAGEVVGTLEVKRGTKPIERVDVVATEDVSFQRPLTNNVTFSLGGLTWRNVVLASMVGFIGVLAIRRYQVVKRKRQRKMYTRNRSY